MPRRLHPGSSLPAHRERGFTLIEMVVVLCIVSVLLAVALLSLHNTRATGQGLETMAVAQTYADSIDRFAREHSGRFPKPPGSADWAGGANAQRGPMADVLGSIKYYLRQVPEAVQGGAVLVGTTSTTKSTLNYNTDAAGSSYELVLAVPTRQPCAIRDGATAITPSIRACSKR